VFMMSGWTGEVKWFQTAGGWLPGREKKKSRSGISLEEERRTGTGIGRGRE
jgi:hypothetical protein